MEFNLCNRFDFAGGGWLQVRVSSERVRDNGSTVYRMECGNDDLAMTAYFNSLAECLASLASWIKNGEAGGFAS